MLEFEQIRKTVEFLGSNNKEVNFYITTNGTLLNPDIVAFLVEHNFQIGISFDGLNHDLYRKTMAQQATSASIIDNIMEIERRYADFFRSNLKLSVTLSPPYNLYNNSVYFREHPLLSRIPLIINSVNSEDNDFMASFDLETENEILSDDYQRLADEYIEMSTDIPYFHRALFDNHVQRLEFRDMSIQTKAYPPGNCAIGCQRLFVTCSGEKYACERVGTYGCLGSVHVKKKQTAKYLNVLLEYNDAVIPGCEDCHLIRIYNYCISTFRRGDKMGEKSQIAKQCERQRNWFDLVMYIYVSKMEQESAL